MVRMIMLSPPGAGKGTHSRWLMQQTGAVHISSGELLRAEIARRSALGQQVAAYTARGDLVPDELILSILLPAVVAAARNNGGFRAGRVPAHDAAGATRGRTGRGARPDQ